MDVKEELDEEWEEWNSWEAWEPDPPPCEPAGDHQDPKEPGASSRAEPLPPPPPPPPGVPETEPNPKSLSWGWGYNSRDRAGWNSWGEKWEWKDEWKWKGHHDKGWHEPWKPTNYQTQKKAPWAKRKRTADGQYVKGGFKDHEGNFWQCLVLSSCFV